MNESFSEELKKELVKQEKNTKNCLYSLENGKQF